MSPEQLELWKAIGTAAGATFGAAVGAFFGQRVNMARVRKVVGELIAERQQAVFLRLEAIERHIGWTKRADQK